MIEFLQILRFTKFIQLCFEMIRVHRHASIVPACISTAQKDSRNLGAPSRLIVIVSTKMKALKRVQDDRKAKEAKSL